MCQQQALAPVEPEQVRVPVLVTRGQVGERYRSSEQGEHSTRAAHDHDSTLTADEGDVARAWWRLGRRVARRGGRAVVGKPEEGNRTVDVVWRLDPEGHMPELPRVSQMARR